MARHGLHSAIAAHPSIAAVRGLRGPLGLLLPAPTDDELRGCPAGRVFSGRHRQAKPGDGALSRRQGHRQGLRPCRCHPEGCATVCRPYPSPGVRENVLGRTRSYGYSGASETMTGVS